MLAELQEGVSQFNASTFDLLQEYSRAEKTAKCKKGNRDVQVVGAGNTTVAAKNSTAGTVAPPPSPDIKAENNTQAEPGLRRVGNSTFLVGLCPEALEVPPEKEEEISLYVEGLPDIEGLTMTAPSGQDIPSGSGLSNENFAGIQAR